MRRVHRIRGAVVAPVVVLLLAPGMSAFASSAAKPTIASFSPTSGGGGEFWLDSSPQALAAFAVAARHRSCA